MRAIIVTVAVAMAAIGCTGVDGWYASTSNDGGTTRPDPFAGPSVCPSSAFWAPDPTQPAGSSNMYPGRPCLACHADPTPSPPWGGETGPSLVVGGTVFATGHAPDACQPTGDEVSALANAQVMVKDANGQVLTIAVRTSGNFYIEGDPSTLALPVTAWVAYGGDERHMVSPQMSADCNTCHTAQGDTGAPGRIVLP